MVKPIASGGASGGKKDPDDESISTLQCRIKNAPMGASYFMLTFISIPLPLRTPILYCRR